MKQKQSTNEVALTARKRAALPSDPEQVMWAALGYAIVSFGILFMILH